mgnify:CR=1 FL=1|jgi:hypothetical protein
MMIILIVSLFLTPYEIAFDDAEELGGYEFHPVHKAIDLLIDFIFFMDVIVTFKVAFLTDMFLVVDDSKEISKNYLNTWFTVDLLSCFPYGVIGKAILSEKDQSYIMLIKLVKLLRILKIVKDREKIFKYMYKYLGIGQREY